MQRLAQKQIIRHPLLWITIFARVGAAIYLLFFPLYGFILSVVFDYIDAFALIHILGLRRSSYYKIDKLLDWVTYVAIIAVSIELGFVSVLFPLVLWRLVGQCINWVNDGWHPYILFPNLIEPVFLWFIVGTPGIWWLVVLGSIQMGRELYIYYFWPRYLRRHGYPSILHIFGQTKRVHW